MLKFISRTNKSQTSSQQRRIVDYSMRGVKARTLTAAFSQDSKDQEHFKDMYGRFISHCGILKMNKEHKYNTLSPGFIDEVYRGVESMNQDRQARVIYLSSRKHEQWSNGTDFKHMRHMSKEENFDQVAAYIEKIYQLQTRVASMNKPIVAVATGHAWNSGATMLSACSYPMMTYNAQLAFNECTFGFVPHSGATYYLSRLPREFGTFMALTGLPIKGADAMRIGLVDNLIDSPADYEHYVAEAVEAQEPGVYDARHLFWELDRGEGLSGAYGNTQFNTPWEDFLIRKGAMQRELPGQDLRRHYQKDAFPDKWSKFTEAKDRIPSSVAEAELKYMQMLREDASKHKNDEGEGYLEWGEGGRNPDGFMYTNFFKDQMGYLKSQLGHSTEEDGVVATQHAAMIGRCFYSDSIEEIKDNLRREDSKFAQECLKAMERNSELSMKVALKMLRKAKNMDYTSAMEMEVDVAMNMVRQENFDLGVSQVLMKPKAKGEKFHRNPGFEKDIKDREIDRFFEPTPESKRVSVGSVKYALLPTRHTYERFSDHLRLWINEQSTPQEEIRYRFDDQAKDALREIGVDVRDKALTMESARKHLAAQLAIERVLTEQADRCGLIMSDQKLREHYFDRINEDLDKLVSDPDAFNKQVNDIIDDVFTNAYLEKLDKVYQKSKEAQKLDKRRMFVRLKKFLFKSRIQKNGQEEQRIQAERLKNFSFRQIHLTEDWETSWHDMSHPAIERSPIHHISKAVGRASLTPIELTREFLTNPQAREGMSVLTLDKEELLKLQDDVFKDPLKYEKMFTKVRTPAEDEWGNGVHGLKIGRGGDTSRERAKLETYDYWFRVLNDGFSRLDTLRYSNRYHAYTEWMSGIEEKALDTLKMAINKLLLAFDEKDSIKTYEKKDGRSKREQIEDLMTLLNEEQEAGKRVKKTKRSAKLASKQRPIDQVESLLDEVLAGDLAFKEVFDLERGSNPLIKDIQAKAKEELLKLLEIVLLDKHGYVQPSERGVLEKRLGSLMAPKGLKDNDQTSAQLRLIDTYLSDENAKVTIQEALDLVKPFFFTQIENMMKQEAAKIADELSVEATHKLVMTYYYLQKQYPEFRDSDVVKKMLSYNLKVDQLEQGYKAIPQLSPTWKKNKLAGSFKEPESLDGQSLEDQKVASIENTKKLLELLATLDNSVQQIKDAAEAENDARNRQFHHKDDERDLEIFWTDREQADLALWEERIRGVIDFLESHRYEIDNHWTQFDYLKVYSQAILDQGINMNCVLQEEEANRKADFVGNDPKTDEQWVKAAEYAKFLHEFQQARTKLNDGPHIDLKEFLARSSASQSPSKESIYQMAMKLKNEEIERQGAKVKTDRTKVIRDQITDYNALIEQSKKRSELAKLIEQKAKTQSPETRAFVQGVLESPQTYINFESLAAQLEKGKDVNGLDIESLIDTDRLIGDIKSGKGPEVIGDHLLDTTIDVVSLAEIQQMMAADSSASAIEQKQLRSIINHVNEQTKYLSNTERKGITMEQFLQSHHYLNASSFESYSNDILHNRLTKILGSKAEDAASIDWQIGEVRTSPVDHRSSYSDAEIEKYLQAIVKKQEGSLPSATEDGLLENYHKDEELTTVRIAELKNVIRDARALTDLPDDFTQYKNFTENLLLKEMMNPNSTDESVGKHVEDYMQQRLKMSMVNSGFSRKVKDTKNGHVYLKVLRERVLEELGLTKEAGYKDLSYVKSEYELSPDNWKFNVESAYNAQDGNNTAALGFDNFIEAGAAETAAGKFDAAQKNAVDKLLADYYLGTRTEYAETNKLMRQLTDIFEKERKDNEEQADLDIVTGFNQEMLHKNIDKAPVTHIAAPAVRDLLTIDKEVSRALQNGKNGLSDTLRLVSIDETDNELWKDTQIPEYFDKFDAKKPTDLYVKDKLTEIIKDAFDTRRKLEKNMSRRELVAFDQVLRRYLQKENLEPLLVNAVKKDYNDVFAGRQVIGRLRDLVHDQEHQQMKYEHNQREYNKSIKNPDAQFKRLAFETQIERRNEAILNNRSLKARDKMGPLFQGENFEHWYADQLELDAKNTPRPINMEDFEPKKLDLADDAALPTFKTQNELEDEMRKEHALYQENKKATNDRIKLFYILEQFYEHSRQHKKDNVSEADKTIREYFADPENTFFFDKNKI